MGRRTRLESPDSGVQITHYNTTTGQLDYTQNSVLIEKGQKIVYQYDEFGRLKKIVYPDNKQLDNTEYEYDENDQIVKKIDNSGEHYYQYGKLGEIVSETIKLKQQTGTIDQQQYHEATFSYKHNYLGQMEEITYPSGEIVKYSYTNGGNVCQVTGKMKFEASDHTFKYVNNITYDKKDRRTSIEYGNGVKSLYEYDEARGWLTRLVTTDRLDRKIQNIEYRFDVTGNVISYTNDCDTFNTTQEYQYDVLGQLIEVNGKSICNKYSSGPEYVADYTQTWKFDNIGRVEKKTSNAVCPLKNDLGGDLLSYSFDYTYIEGKANQVGSCTGRYYAYDANGNMTIEQNVPIETETTGYIATVTQVKDDAYYVDQAWGVENDKQTAVSGISRRIFEYNCKNEMIVSKDSNYYTKYIYNQEGQRTSKYSSLGESLYFNEYASWTKRSGDSGNPDGRDAMHIYINGQRIVTKQNSATRYELSDQINKQYWYHTNHIGNVDVITERDGNQFERFEYTPYGETWIHHDSLYLNNSNLGIFGDSIDIKYRFTGKENDEETGYTYFGARYLDSKRGIWTQTDPALGDYIPTAGTTPDKLPGMGGIYNLVNSQLYHYAGNNPVKYTDPDGKMDLFAQKFETIYIPKDIKNATTIKAQQLKKEWNIWYDSSKFAAKFYHPVSTRINNDLIENTWELIGDDVLNLLVGSAASTGLSKLTTFLELIAPNVDEKNFNKFNDFFRNIDTESNIEIEKEVSISTSVKDKEVGGANLHGKVITTTTSIRYTRKDTGEYVTLETINVKNVLTTDWNKYYKVEIVGEQ